MDSTVLDDRVKHLPDWKREVTASMDKHKVRVVIERDFYSKQNRIYVEVFDLSALKWNTLQSLAGAEYTNLPQPGETNDQTITDATDDLVEELFAYAKLVLS